VAIEQQISCACNGVSMAISAAPLFRACCHCTTCQRFNAAPYADVTIFRATDVTLADDTSVEFQNYQKPPLVQRGKCTSCNSPAIENISLPVLPNLRVVPSILLPADLQREIAFHIFYHRRVQDVDDDTPKHLGFVSSQLAFMRTLISALRR